MIGKCHALRLRTVSPQGINNRALLRRTVPQAAAIRIRSHRHRVPLLRPPHDMVVVPDLVQHRLATAIGALVADAREVRHGAKGLRQRRLDVGQAVGGGVAGHDAGGGEPGVGGHGAVKGDGGGKEVDDFLVRHVLRAVAGWVKGRVAGCVLGELVGPEDWRGLGLGDPVSGGDVVVVRLWNNLRCKGRNGGNTYFLM